MEKYHKTLKIEYGLFNGKTRFVLATVNEENNGHYSVKLKLANNYLTIFCEDTTEISNLFRCLGDAGRIFDKEMNKHTNGLT
jgi:hypothetical protein